ncbi:hypothetical protein DV702_03055 [Sporosarcina sp. PTS2304]|uniref:hypothetical protein n=1 Tax=Sporosarcina sp. PTS2304 TaxID=2283194 RepID=UPI000E0D2850|nr:hypothetical protein [Sporosarcina sp. PTS2304]AXH98788.1 hypothetical protein DV702_03055 [Sporosarcina sp. PTS2304]
MKFLHIVYCEKDAINQLHLSDTQISKVHQAPIEHAIVHWMRKNVVLPIEINSITYYDFPKDKVELFYDILTKAHAQQSQQSARPWKYLPIPDEEEYPYKIAEYEKEYGTVYYDSLYKYITAIGVILQIFDFETKRLLVCIK